MLSTVFSTADVFRQEGHFIIHIRARKHHMHTQGKMNLREFSFSWMFCRAGPDCVIDVLRALSMPPSCIDFDMPTSTVEILMGQSQLIVTEPVRIHKRNIVRNILIFWLWAAEVFTTGFAPDLRAPRTYKSKNSYDPNRRADTAKKFLGVWTPGIPLTGLVLDRHVAIAFD
jgi:hypothetical protein